MIQTIGVIAHNRPELEKKIEKKYNLIRILKINRKFLKFDNKGYKYRYKVKVILRKRDIFCQNCHGKIKTLPGFFKGQTLCQDCYNWEKFHRKKQ